jgi:hypothetical protein
LTSEVAPASQPSDSLSSREFDFTISGDIAGGFSGRTMSGPFGITNCIPTPETVEAQISFDSSCHAALKSRTMRFFKLREILRIGETGILFPIRVGVLAINEIDNFEAFQRVL